MPRVIQIPLSGGDRKAQAKELRRARGLYDEYMKQAAVVRAEVREKDRRADQLECSAWNTIMFCGGPAQPSPTIETALNAGYDQLEVRCNRCGRLSRADLAKVHRPGNTPLHLLEAALFCQECSQSKKWKQRAHIFGLASNAPPDAEPPKRALPQGFR
jgi:phage terminase large subunit GpA-like protein